MGAMVLRLPTETKKQQKKVSDKLERNLDSMHKRFSHFLLTGQE